MSNVLDLFKLDGKVAVVTGGSRGLGYFAALGLAEAGANVVICGRDISGDLRNSLKAFRRTNRDCIAIKCDVTQEDDVVKLAEATQERFGRCDILVNNIGTNNLIPFDLLRVDDWNHIMNVNLLSTFLCCREFGNMMLQEKSGSIINFSSENGQVGFSGSAAYATAKTGIIGLTRTLAVEWGPSNIRVNAILPGNMEEGQNEALKDKTSEMYKLTGENMLRMTPLGIFGNGNDIKSSVVYLASEASRYITGANLVLDGGFSINSGI